MDIEDKKPEPKIDLEGHMPDEVEYPKMLPGLSNGMALYFGRIAGLNATNLEH